MTARLVYLAHPVKPMGGESLRGNFESAEEYRQALSNAGVLVVAPWMWELQLRLDVGVFSAAEGKDREVLLQRCERYASACWAVALCGPRVSEGMEREWRACGQLVDCIAMNPSRAVAEVLKAFAWNESNCEHGMPREACEHCCLGDWWGDPALAPVCHPVSLVGICPSCGADS